MLSLQQRSLMKKLIMAISGIVLLLFIIVHTLGNLSIHLGAGYINAYAHHIHELGIVLWIERAVMIVAALVHIFLGVVLTLENWQARPKGYIVRRYLESDFSTRTMIYTGGIILVFIVYHLLHLTFHSFNPEFAQVVDVKGRHDVYFILKSSFEQILYAGTYCIALVALLLHLWHGIRSFFQTLGWNNQLFFSWIEIGGKTLALLIFLVMISIPARFFITTLF